MIRFTHISQLLFRTVACLVAMLLACVGTWGQTMPSGSGTVADPYVVSNVEHLKWIADGSGNNRWGTNGHYVQTADLDLTGVSLAPIGNKTTAFTGSYDGGGHVISNLKVDWTGVSANNSNVAFGLFGVCTGTIKNLVIDGATVTRAENTTVNWSAWTTECTVRVGVLVGVLGNKGKVKNIIVRNSTITDNGTDPVADNYFIGGVIGDVAESYSTWNALNGIEISNIYADVDIDLSHVSRKSTVASNAVRKHQFLIGGIAGRMRYAKKELLPVNTFYTGNVNAPIAMIGPCYGGHRWSGTSATGGYFTSVYAGQNESDTKCWDTEDGIDQDRYFFGYSIAGIAIDQDFLDNHCEAKNTVDEKWWYGTHTIKGNYRLNDASKTIDYTSAEEMKSFQGVNHGTLTDVDGVRELMLEYNAENYSTWEYLWDAANLSWTNTKMPAAHSLTIAQTQNGAVATLSGAQSGESFRYAWKYLSKEDHLWHIIKLTDAPELTNFAFNTKIEKLKVVLCDATGKAYSDNNQLVKAECDVVVTEFLEVTVTESLPTQTVAAKVVNGANEEVSGYTFAVQLCDKTSGEVLKILPMTGGTLTLNAIARPVTLKVVATKAGVDGQLESEIKEIRYIDVEKFTKTKDVTNKIQRYTRSDYYFYYLNDGLLFDDGTPFSLPSDYFKAKWEFTNNGVLNDRYITPDWDDDATYQGTWENRIKENNKANSAYIIRDNSYYIYVKDVLLVRNDVVFTLTDQYGLSSSVKSTGTGNDLTPLNMSMADDPSGYQRYKITFYSNATFPFVEDMLNDVTCTIQGAEITTPQTVEFAFDDKTNEFIFSVNSVSFEERKYTLTVADKLGNTNRVDIVVPFSSLSIGQKDGKCIPLLNGFEVDPSLLEEIGWSVDYKKNGTVETETYDTSEIELEPYDCDITLTVKDKFGHTSVVTWSKSVLQEQGVGISITSEGTHPDLTFTAVLTSTTGTPPTGGTWQWYAVNGDITDTGNNVDELIGETSNVLVIDKKKNNDNYSTYIVAWTSDEGAQLTGYWSLKSVIYVYNKTATATANNGRFVVEGGRFHDLYNTYPDGDDLKDGRTPRTAVKTMRQAFRLLASDMRRENNIIVVMGCNSDDDFWTIAEAKKDYMQKDVTLTGNYGEIANGMVLLAGGSETRGMGGATTLEKITLYGGGTGELLFYCNLHDLTVGNEVKIEGYGSIDKNENGLGDYTAPKITLVGGIHQYDNKELVYPASNAIEGVTSIDIFSGCWGRIIASARNDDAYNTISNNIFGHPDWPHRVRVNVAIQHVPGMTLNEYTPGITDPANLYPYDIGLLVGGQTDGSVYVDAKLQMLSGKVGRFISGNISYGRKTGKGFPADGFYGSTELNLEGGEVGELVGGTLGRWKSTSQPGTEKCDAYFYGRSILNINGGVIHNNIYGAGAGGVVGLCDDEKGDDYHTYDLTIPYLTGDKDAKGNNVVRYGDYATVVGKMPTFIMDEENEHLEFGIDNKRNVLDLAKSYCEVNINGGVIEGNVYGGGYGHSKQVAVDKALEQAGDLFGRSFVTVNGGIIKGNVYGGGAGAKNYQLDPDKPANADFTKLACIYGDTQVEVKGGIIEGCVYAGSQGIEGFPDMATVYGNTSLIVSDVEDGDNTTKVPLINNNIYGGSELGHITGDTHVRIQGGAIGNCIFGGSEGIEADVKDANGKVEHRKTTAYVEGSTNLVISGGTYFTEDHDNKISEGNRLSPTSRTFNIYGGGYKNCIVAGNTNLHISKSLLSSYKCLIEPDPSDATKKRTFEDCVKDETYRKFSVYGAGRGELTDVKGNTNLIINIEGGASVPSSKPVDVANGQQFFMIAGGGMAGHVWGDANVTLDGNVFARRIYGGGMYGNVLGNVNMTVRRGSYYGIFGGGLLGNVRGRNDSQHAANLQIGTRIGEKRADGSTVTAEEAADANRNLYVYDNVYGGNDVSGCTGYMITNNLWNDGNYDTFYTLDGILSASDEVKSHHYLFEHWSEFNNGQPYYRHLIKADESKGVNMIICGGKILGDVFGAGNGNHTGYYVPNMADSESHAKAEYEAGTITRMKFYEGLPYHYRVNKKDKNSYDGTPTYNSATNSYTGTLKSVLNTEIRKDYGLYEYRPRVGKVVMHIGGNSASDRVYIGGDVFGGGHACTIGKYDPARDVLTDPLRFEGGGSLTMNFGSHVTVKDAVYMGSRGRIIGQQTIQGEHEYNNITLNSDMDYHYYDHSKNKYLLGFPNTLEGRMRFHAYMQLVNMDATTELSFYDQLDNSESTDLRWGSFFAGGARGSMTKQILSSTDSKYNPAKTKPYEYTLPVGLTIETKVVGGSEDAEITYCEYKKNADGTYDYTQIDETKPIFTFLGGIVYDSHDPNGHHYGGGRVKWHDDFYDEAANVDATLTDDEKMVGDESPRGSLVVMKLNVNCQFDPQPAEAKNVDFDKYKNEPGQGGEVAVDPDDTYYGGLVYGGCYKSGITNGSVEVVCTNNMLGDVHFESDNFTDYLEWSSLRRNVGRVYGGGFGASTSILGNTKVTLANRARCFNVFGGGMMGNVTGGTEIEVKDRSLVYNAIYGGGMRGNVGKESYNVKTDADLTAKGTHIKLVSGGIDRVYGGAFMSDVYGGTHVTASDADAANVIDEDGVNHGPVRLMVGSIFGGNDVSGTIYEDAATGLSTNINVSETASEHKTPANHFYLTSPSTAAGESGKFYAGYPMIGTIYGAGNGNMADYIKGVVIDKENNRYRSGKIHIATGDSANYAVYDMDELHLPLPDVDKASINITGGTIVNVYAGGSMCTTRESNNVTVYYADTIARAAFVTAEDDPMTWGILRLFKDLQKSEVTTSDLGSQKELTRFSYQIYRVFGGNNLMDMSIQPTLDLQRGQLFSVYSGGNFGRMTNPNGLTLTVNSPDINIASIYGGGRVGDIDAVYQDTSGGHTKGEHIEFADDKYGATLNILDGIIGDVYGGNNVAGTVFNGTNVNIHGAISGNVYGSGNGNYIYYYDHDNTKGDPNYPGMITEDYDEDFGGRYFILPQKEAYPGQCYGTSDEEKILAINRYRPNVEKAFLNIHGTPASGSTPAKTVYVLGNVYCGGNSSTVLFNPKYNNGGNIRFEIGSNVTLGGVFLGSNGEGLANPFNISYLANLNGITDMGADNNIVGKAGFADKSKLHFNDQVSYDTHLYPNLLSLYMRAAEVTALPTNFNLPTDATEAYIGNFCFGGNYGSMMTDNTIDLTLPENLTIFGRVVGGCYNSRLEYQGAVALGGMTHPLNPAILKDGKPITDKVYMKVRSKFRPWRMVYDDVNHIVSLVNDRVDYDGNYVSDAEAAAASSGADAPTYYYEEGRCNVFGGCYTSGKTVGGIKIDYYSDALGRYVTPVSASQYITVNGEKVYTDNDGRLLQVNKQMMMNNVSLRRTVFAITGAGYGPLSDVEGDVNIRLLPQQTAAAATTHPSVCTIFGGAHNGKNIGNSTTEIRDGMVFSSLYAGSRAAIKYGSSEVIIGYPKYYVCNESGTYTLNRADNISYVAQAQQATPDADGVRKIEKGNKTFYATNHDGTDVIKQTVMYRVGDIVAANVYEQIIDDNKSTKFDKIDNVDNVDNVDNSITPVTFGSSWDNISINIGDNSHMNDLAAPFYGGGGIYGGGHAINESAMSYSGINTQLAFTDAVIQQIAAGTPAGSTPFLTTADLGYGGNSTIIVGDNPENTLLANTVGSAATVGYGGAPCSGSIIKDHISIGTGHYVEVAVPETGDKMGKYALVNGEFVHQPTGKPGDPDENGVKQYTGKYYKMETDGGIYGDGRRTFVEKFRAVDVTGYGYADCTPQSARLINTFQRIDLLSLNDCCLQLQGAQDYATNTIDATHYSIARVGEIRFNSTLTGNLTASAEDPKVAGNLSLDAPRSRNYMGFFKNVHYIGAIYSNTDFGTESFRGADGKETALTYKAKKQEYIDAYNAESDKTPEVEKAFKQRNLGTAPNMIGINNGYTLKVQNAFTTDGGTNSGMLKDVATDNIYYGPIFGVVEVKLLTLAADEGGGYIYAFNKHEQSGSDHTFLEETGNFVYPAAIDNSTDNYIVDDCYPTGYYESGHSSTTDEEVHYWYVTGRNYYYNTTLTAYTYNNPINFKLNNADDLILLSGIHPNYRETIEIESIVWEQHVTDSDKCALTNDLNPSAEKDSREDYQLYLTIDSHTDNEYDLRKSGSDYTNIGNAFVARIPNGNGTGAYGTDANGDIQYANNYSHKSASEQNSPLLGIRLQDTDTENNDPEFFQTHLADPHNVVIKIKAKEDDSELYNHYTINLSIVYLQGPYIEGEVEIENCALPGEYIYANTKNVTALMDNSLTVTGKRWYLYPKIKPDPTKEIYQWDRSEQGRVDVTQYLMDNVAGDVNRIELPARYYQNDWKLGYSIVVNGQPFDLREPDNQQDPNNQQEIQEPKNRITVHNYHRMSTVARAVKNMTNGKGGTVTNYGYDLDLDLVGGALVYIEDEHDFEVFTKYVNYCNSFRSSIANSDKAAGYDYEVKDGVVWQIEKDNNGTEKHRARVLRAQLLPGYNANGYITGYNNGKTILGFDDDQDVRYQNIKDPSGAEGILFVLTADVTTTKNCMPIEEFRGILNGNGHAIIANKDYVGQNLIVRNYGEIHSLGVVSNGGDDNQAVIKENYGSVENTFYYYFQKSESETTEHPQSKYASLIGENLRDDYKNVTGWADNCYQNTDKANADALAGVRYRTNLEFHNGLVAYNLNQHYLKARYNSHGDHDMVYEYMMDANAGATGLEPIKYLYEYYADGDYRYAHVRSAEHPEGLRLTANNGVPNYENNLRNGQTMHERDLDKVHDERRWFTLRDRNGEPNNAILMRDERGNIQYTVDDDGNTVPVMTNSGYFPIYLYDRQGNLADHSDFIMFGQRLIPETNIGQDRRQYYPHRINSRNRVYRATGTYGSRTDYGFHFNRDVHAMQPTLTAIDFTGYLDLPYADNNSNNANATYAARWQFYIKNENVDVDDPQHLKYLNLKHYQHADDLNYEDYIQRTETDSLMQLIFYPPALDLPGGNEASCISNLTSFDVDTNTGINDYAHVTKNLLVYTPEISAVASTAEQPTFDQAKSDELFGKLHYTRRQAWNDVDGETEQEDIIGHHLQWKSHVGTSLTSHFHAYDGLFHLVDEQNFNAPISFYVAGDGDEGVTNGRAWMKRLPKFYATRPSSPQLGGTEGGFLIGRNGWESIALPFTCNRVVAVNADDYIEKYSRGQITHFYGTDPERGITHHDYWLRGLVAAQPDTHSDDIEAMATFARPGKKKDNLFEIVNDEQMRGDYTYSNNWFGAAYPRGTTGYIHNEYADTLQYLQYCYLTKNAPYIVAFPGDDYYEFDLSGRFYNRVHGNETGCHEQEILYEYSVDAALLDKNTNYNSDVLNVRIPVTDVYDEVHRTVVSNGAYTLTHNATFMRIADDDITDRMFVLNTQEVTSVDTHGTQVNYPPGSVFINCRDFGITEILPFRTYIEAPASESHSAPRLIAIGSGSLTDDIGEPDEQEPYTEDLDALDRITISVVGSTLYITSPDDCVLPLHSVSGQLIDRLTVHTGRNAYHNIPAGIYIVNGKKFIIR